MGKAAPFKNIFSEICIPENINAKILIQEDADSEGAYSEDTHLG